METKAERRERKRRKKRDGMQVSGRSIKSILQHQTGVKRRRLRRKKKKR
jgi:hypothetical protein